jgi:hypothetical protein
MPSKDKEEVKEYNKQYYAKNKEKLLQAAKVKVVCPHCNKTVNKENMIDHKKSKYCQKRVAKTNEVFTKIKEVIDSLVSQLAK